jgi:hypothetical protein
MTTMRIPGFTADKAVHTTHGNYQCVINRIDSGLQPKVVAQLRNSFGCAGCVWSCFTAGGAPFFGCYGLCRAFGYCNPF